CLLPDRSVYPTAVALSVPSVARAGTASTCVNFPGWTRFKPGIRKQAPKILLNCCRRPSRQKSGSGSKKQATHGGSELDFPKLAGSVGGQIRITDRPPLIFHPKTAHDSEAEATLKQVFHAYRKSLADDRCMLLNRYRLVDIAIKVVGVGSVGRSCWIALMM